MLTINETYYYVLIEFPSSTVLRYADQVFFDLQLAGYQPVIVHPERNKQIIEQPHLLYSLVKYGVFSQLTAGSISGGFGKKIQRFSHQLLGHNLIHIVATDAHNISTRGFCLTDSYEVVKNGFGSDMLFLLSENAEDVIKGRVLAAEPPENVKKQKFLAYFKV
ncbi:CpsB/CapC family capsule biosynthesis tyrosine phosphatase [Halobacillus sp. BBL2006]|uniref:CpsB/CapC family capsule biosynthesis tyrosine phosphatase n=1 Tax=Halobacillus sp. BBL2006 TaxID=1543706 RepID=UPI00350F0947